MTTKYRTITMTKRAPVRINEDLWPQIACGRTADYEGEYEFQSHRRWRAAIRVRQHADGRSLVYGTYSFDSDHQDEPDCDVREGFLLDSDGDIPAAIREVAETLASGVHADAHASWDIIAGAARQCLADMPAEEI